MSDDEAKEREQLERFAEGALRVVSVLGVAFFCAMLLTYRHGRDQGIYAIVARSLVEGGMPYRDAWDFKPPGIFFVYASARVLFGASQAGIRIVEAAGLLGTVWLFTRLTERWWGDRSIGLVAGALYALCHAQLDFWHTAQPESFGGMLTILGLWAGERSGVFDEARPVISARRTPPSRLGEGGWLFAAGAAFGAAGLLKPPLAGAGAVLAAFVAFGDVARSRAALADLRAWFLPALRRTGWIVLGGAAPFALCLAFFAAKGALGDLRETLLVFTPHYTKLGWERVTFSGMFYWGVQEWFIAYASTTPVGLALLAALGPRPLPTLRPRVLGDPRPSASARPVWLLLAVILMQILGVVMQGKFFPYHYGATWPVTALLAALGFVNAMRYSVARGWVFAAGCGALFVATPYLRSSTKDLPQGYWERCGIRLEMLAGRRPRPLTDDQLASVADVNAVANRAVADFIRDATPPGAPIFVWGFEPVIYDLAERPLASRFTYDVPQRVDWAQEATRRVLMDDLAKRPPAAIVVEHRDVFPMVTGDNFDSAQELYQFAELDGLIAREYAFAFQYEDLDVYLRGEPPTVAAPTGR